MAGKAPNLKINIGADTSDFTKGAKAAKQELKAFEGTAKGALDGIADAFGVNTGKLAQMSDALRGMGAKLSECGAGGARAFGSILSAINPVTTAIAGLGIGAAVTAFRALNDEAENFKTTVAGANIEMATAAYVDTYKQVLHDFNAGTGESVAIAESKWQKFWKTFGANVKTYITSGQLGLDQMDPAERLSLSSAGMDTNPFSTQTGVATKQAERAAEIANEIYQLQRQASDQSRITAELDAIIAEKRKEAYDTTDSTAERQKALADFVELTKLRYYGISEETQTWADRLGLVASEAAEGQRVYNGTIDIQRQISRLMDENNDLAASSPEQIDAANKQYVQTETQVANINNELKSTSRLQSTIAKQAAKEAEAREKSAKALESMANAKAGLAEFASMSESLPSLPTATATTEIPVTLAPREDALEPVKDYLSFNLPLLDKTIFLEFDYDQSNLLDISDEIKQTISSLSETTGSVLGELAGDLLTGGDAWGNFANNAISAFGDMAIAVGKMAIATGTAALGIKAALESLNPWMAIAAGVALVALGTAVKTGLSNVASGNYNTSSNVASSSTAVANSDYSTAEISVNVTGTLRADGNELVTVIQNTEKKNGYTT